MGGAGGCGPGAAGGGQVGPPGAQERPQAVLGTAHAAEDDRLPRRQPILHKILHCPSHANTTERVAASKHPMTAGSVASCKNHITERGHGMICASCIGAAQASCECPAPRMPAVREAGCLRQYLQRRLCPRLQAQHQRAPALRASPAAPAAAAGA